MFIIISLCCLFIILINIITIIIIRVRVIICCVLVIVITVSVSIAISVFFSSGGVEDRLIPLKTKNKKKYNSFKT